MRLKKCEHVFSRLLTLLSVFFLSVVWFDGTWRWTTYMWSWSTWAWTAAAWEWAEMTLTHSCYHSITSTKQRRLCLFESWEFVCVPCANQAPLLSSSAACSCWLDQVTTGCDRFTVFSRVHACDRLFIGWPLSALSTAIGVRTFDCDRLLVRFVDQLVGGCGLLTSV